MVETISIKTVQAPAGSLKQSIAEYALGNLSRPEITVVIFDTFRADPGCGPAIQEYLDTQFNAQQLSTADYRELTQILSSTLTESVPTEHSEEAPEESGLYRIDSEGTLILSDDFEALAAPPIAAQKEKQAKEAADSPAQSVLNPGTVLRDRFRLDEEVASGSMGIVYKATDLLKLDAGANAHTVAIKVINPEFANDHAALKSFQNEVANTQLLSHPNIIHLFELDRDNEHYFITMEWLEGESLDALLDRSQGSALPPIQAYAIIEQLCDALAYSHEQNVVHADIKPGNVFLTKPGELKLIDFGIAHYDEAGTESQDDDNAIALTPAYASCECLEKMKPTAQDDLFSLACLIYRLLSGRRVFGMGTALQAELKGSAPVRIGGMSDERWDALSKALSFRRAGRQVDVATFAEEFGQRNESRIVDEPEEIEDEVHTETSIIQALPDDIPNELLAPDEFVAISAEQVEQLSSPDLASVFPEVVATTSSTDIQDLAEMPAPINFFDDDSDDSMFVPVEPVSTGTDRLEASLASTDTANLESSQASTSTANLEAALASTGTEDFAVPGASTGTEDLTLQPTASSSQHVGGQVTLREIELIPQQTDAPVEPAASKPAAAEESGAIADSKPQAKPKPQAQAKPKPKPKPTPKAKDASADTAEDTGTVTIAVLADKNRFPDKPGGNLVLDRLRSIPATQRIAAAATVAIVAVLVGVLLQGDDAGESVVANAPPVAAPTDILVQSQPVLINTNGQVRSLTAVPETGNAAQGVGIDAVADGEVAAPVDAFAALPVAAEPDPVVTQMPLNTADTGIALMAVAVPLPLGSAAQSSVDRVSVSSVQQTAAVAPTQSVPPQQISQSQVITRQSPQPKNQPVPAVSSPQAIAASTLSPYMQQAYRRASEALAAGRLVAPTYDCAIYWLGEMRVREPFAEVVKQTEIVVGKALLARAEAAVVQSDLIAAERWLELAAVNGANPTEVSAVRRSLSLQSRQNNMPAAAVVTGRASKADDSVRRETTGTVAIVKPQTVALSDLEFTKFVEPEVRQNAIDGSPDGWVDVAFTVNTAGETTGVTLLASNLSSHYAAPSIAAVEKWRFEPYSQDGAARTVNTEVRLRFDE